MALIYIIKRHTRKSQCYNIEKLKSKIEKVTVKIRKKYNIKLEALFSGVVKKLNSVKLKYVFTDEIEKMVIMTFCELSKPASEDYNRFVDRRNNRQNMPPDMEDIISQIFRKSSRM